MSLNGRRGKEYFWSFCRSQRLGPLFLILPTPLVKAIYEVKLLPFAEIAISPIKTLYRKTDSNRKLAFATEQVERASRKFLSRLVRVKERARE